jgi:hypothetical protein
VNETTGQLIASLPSSVSNFVIDNTLPPVSPGDFGTTPAIFDMTWNIVGTGSFNYDGCSSVVWQQQISGLVELQLFEGTRETGGTRQYCF